MLSPPLGFCLCWSHSWPYTYCSRVFGSDFRLINIWHNIYWLWKQAANTPQYLRDGVGWAELLPAWSSQPTSISSFTPLSDATWICATEVDFSRLHPNLYLISRWRVELGTNLREVWRNTPDPIPCRVWSLMIFASVAQFHVYFSWVNACLAVSFLIVA